MLDTSQQQMNLTSTVVSGRIRREPSTDFEMVMKELVQLRALVSTKVEVSNDDRHYKRNYDQVMDEMLHQRHKASTILIEQQKEAQSRQDALLDKWMQDQVELREVFRLEREEARLERSEAQARQDILVTKLFEQNEVLSNLVMQQNEEIIRMKGVQGVGIGNGLGVGEYFRREVKSILMR